MSKMCEDLNDAFAGWNPMKEDYLDSEFNFYDSGPGAGLDSGLQPAELAKRKASNINKPYLVFRKLPKNMTQKSLKNLCQRHGKVENHYERKGLYFVYFYNIADMEATYRALGDGEYGFQVSIGTHFLKHKEKQQIETAGGKNYRSIPDRVPSSSDINIEDRTILPSGKKPQRPSLNSFRDNFNELTSEKSPFSKNDPLIHCVNVNDAHSLERAGIKIPGFEASSTDDYKYRAGRAYINMPEKIKKFIEEKHESSSGTYDTDLEKYLKNMTKNENPEIKKCIVCKTPADISCYRCGPNLYIYCGKKCQNEDWDNHRLICGKGNASPRSPCSSNEITNFSPNQKMIKENISLMPATPSSASSSSSVSVAAKSPQFEIPKMPQSNSTILMTAIRNINIVFIRSKAADEVTKFFEIVNKIQARVKRLKPLYDLPQVGEAVVAKLEETGEYGRAIVLKAANIENIEINFFDYGNFETLKLENLYKAPSEFMECPRFAVPVKLKNVPESYMTNEVRAFMYSYLRDIELIVKYDKTDDLLPNKIYCVDLYDASTNQHLNKTIATLCKPQEPKDNDEIMTIQNLHKMEMPVGSNIEFFVFDNSQLNTGCISGTTRIFAKEIEKFKDEIQDYANSTKQLPYAPRQDELCLAKYSEDGLWYRGRCLEKVGDGKPTIHYIDYGNIDFVPVKNIRAYPPKFKWPIYTADFEIQGLPEKINNDLLKRLEELFPLDRPICADTVEHVEGIFYSLTMKGVIETLKDEELLE